MNLNHEEITETELGEQTLPGCLNGRSFRQWEFLKQGNKEIRYLCFIFKTWVGRGKRMFLEKRGTLDYALLIEMFFVTSGCLWRTHCGPGTAGITTEEKHGSKTHVRETEQ